MSYTEFSHLTELVNKKVLFYDLETSGLPINKGYKELVENRYYPYKTIKNKIKYKLYLVFSYFWYILSRNH